MALAGEVVVRLARNDASEVLRWLRGYQPRAGMFGSPIRSPTSLGRRLQKFAERKPGPQEGDRPALRLSRTEARWLASVIHGAGGMFGHRTISHVPLGVRDLCAQCDRAVHFARRGRPRLTGRRLDEAYERSVDERTDRQRHRLAKRLDDRDQLELALDEHNKRRVADPSVGPILGEKWLRGI